MTTPFDVVEVEWLDSVRASGGWTDLEQIPTDAPAEALVHRTAGYLVAEDETSMLLAGSYQAWLPGGQQRQGPQPARRHPDPGRGHRPDARAPRGRPVMRRHPILGILLIDVIAWVIGVLAAIGALYLVGALP